MRRRDGKRIHLFTNPKHRDVFMGVTDTSGSEFATSSPWKLDTKTEIQTSAVDYLEVLRGEVDIPLRAQT